MNDNNYNNRSSCPEPWDSDRYETGSTQPPKHHRGAIAVLLISLALPILFYFKFLPYKKMKQKIGGTFLLDVPVRFTVKKGTVGGFFILTERSMVFLSRECTTTSLELSHDDVKRVSMGQNMTINIYLNNTQFIRVFTGSGEEMLDVLRRQGWNVTE